MLLSSSRLNSLKQVDRTINVLRNLMDYEFVYVVTGHGTENYERYLRSVGEPLLRSGHLKFLGHVPQESLRNIYNAADFFIMSSYSEAGPTSSLKALAMEVPVFTTDTGQMAEILSKHDAGVIVPRRDYKIWERELREILSGKKVKLLGREIVRKIHHWPYVAKQYIELYNRLLYKYYGNNNKR